MVDQKQQVLNWLKAGAVWKDGVSLFKNIFGAQHPFIILIRKGGSELKYQILKQALSSFRPQEEISLIVAPQPQQKLRHQFPFLNTPNCPVEFKVLVADKITAYHNYTSAHQKLYDCETPVQCYNTIAQVVENYIENRRILKELDHYAKHKKVLGKHPVFKLFKRIEELKAMKAVDLVKLRDKLLHNIWRINSEIKKGDKPHLYHERCHTIKEKEQEIIEIDRILERYA